jgi:hypothetical protein
MTTALTAESLAPIGARNAALAAEDARAELDDLNVMRLRIQASLSNLDQTFRSGWLPQDEYQRIVREKKVCRQQLIDIQCDVNEAKRRLRELNIAASKEESAAYEDRLRHRLKTVANKYRAIASNLANGRDTRSLAGEFVGDLDVLLGT